MKEVIFRALDKTTGKTFDVTNLIYKDGELAYIHSKTHAYSADNCVLTEYVERLSHEDLCDKYRRHKLNL